MSTQPREQFEELLLRKLALASLTGGDRSIGIVRLWTKTTEFFLYIKNRGIAREKSVSQNLENATNLQIKPKAHHCNSYDEDVGGWKILKWILES
jgi:hypothetical protein